MEVARSSTQKLGKDARIKAVGLFGIFSSYTCVNHDPGFNSSSVDYFSYGGNHGTTGTIIQWCLLHSSLVRYTLPSSPNSLNIKYYTYKLDISLQQIDGI